MKFPAILILMILMIVNAHAQTPFDFSVIISPSSQKITAGETISYSVVVSLINGTSQDVSLNLSGLPNESLGGIPGGSSYVFSPASGNATFSSILSITTLNTTLEGTYTVIVMASGGKVTKYVAANLVIEAPTMQKPSRTSTPTITPNTTTNPTITETITEELSENTESVIAQISRRYFIIIGISTIVVIIMAWAKIFRKKR